MSNENQLFLTGKLKEVMDVQTFGSGFTKREFVITTIEKYPQDVKLELTKDKTSLVDSFKVGSELKVYFNVRGNEYNGKYFVGLTCWKIEPVESKQDAIRNHPTKQAAVESLGLTDDDLPF